MLRLIIGNKAYSSWSLRPWFLLRQAGIEFEDQVVPLYQPDSREALLRYSPTGKVPCLIDGDLTIWESLAICEYVAEQFPEKQLWPADRALRAEARAYASEMHAGFFALRQHCPFNARRQFAPREWPADVQSDLVRIGQIWSDLRRRHQHLGPFLYGQFSVVDAMFVPVASRARTYALPLPELAQGYADMLLDLPAMREWYAAGAAEPWVVPGSEP
ncbi:glutathione S-transferase family protein [Chitinimonas lacunae]|uniref:Glutathione S-transferase family protein n=1 Tax=Chitinimonas lacunae TaxID=1963018 RepID=A0ABV8MTC7_9NEIS